MKPLKKHRVILFCGEQSPYGLAHLRPFIESRFEVVAVVIATENRWKVFRQALAGKRIMPMAPWAALWRRLSQTVKNNSPAFFLLALGRHAPVWKGELDLVRSRRIPIWEVDDVNADSCVEQIRRTQADLLVSAAYPQIFSKELLEATALGGVNFHPSLLPRFRGAHPHYWAIATGEPVSGVTAHFMTEELDAGDIIAQVAYDISALNYSEHYDKIISETRGLVQKVEAFFLDGIGTAQKQDTSQVSLYRNDREIHHRIFWETQSTREIVNLVRTERAFCFFRQEKVSIFQARSKASNRNLTNKVQPSPGMLVDICSDSLCIMANDGCIYVQELACGKKRFAAVQWAAHFRPLIGERFS
jgi:methionyl-tRNA formyltransferase